MACIISVPKSELLAEYPTGGPVGEYTICKEQWRIEIPPGAPEPRREQIVIITQPVRNGTCKIP